MFLKRYLIYYFLFLVLLYSIYFNHSLWYLLIIYGIFIKHRLGLKMIGILVVVGIVAWQVIVPFPKSPTIIKAEVIQKSMYSVTVFDGLNRYTLSSSDTQLELYEMYQFSVNDCNSITSTHNDHLFNYMQYAKSIRLLYRCKITDATKLNQTSIMSYVNRYLNRYSPLTRSYIEDMVLGLNANQIKESVMPLSITYLIVISGMHFTLLEKIIERLLGFLAPRIRTPIKLIILFFYLFILRFSVSALRAFLMIVFKHLSLNRLDSLSLSGMFLLLVNRYYVFHPGFVLSFYLTLVTLLLKDQKKWIHLFFLFPIVIMYQFEFNATLLINQLIFTPLFTGLYYMLLVVMVIPFLDVFVSLYIQLLTFIIALVIPWQWMIVFAYPSIQWIMLYGIGMGLMIKRKVMWSVAWFIVLILFLKLPYNQSTLVFIDVGQGDSILIRHLSYTVLIDTGTSYATENSVIPYLKSLGITKLDQLIITHPDSDHAGGIELIHDSFKVKETVLTMHDPIVYNHLTIHNLNPHTNILDNDQSMVLYVQLEGVKLLLMADVGSAVELDLLTNYPYLKADLLKIGHHGSNESSHSIFLRHVIPNVAINSVGLNNRYNHPNKDVLKRLEYLNIPLIETRLSGMIKVQIKSNQFYIYTNQ